MEYDAEHGLETKASWLEPVATTRQLLSGEKAIEFGPLVKPMVKVIEGVVAVGLVIIDNPDSLPTAIHDPSGAAAIATGSVNPDMTVCPVLEKQHPKSGIAELVSRNNEITT